MAGLLVSPTLPCACRSSFAAGSRLQARPCTAAVSASRTPLMVQAKLSKAADFRGLSQEEIAEEVQKAKRGLFDLRIKQKTREELKTSDFDKLKLKIAQLLTVSREKEISEGLTSKRERRRKEKKENVAAGFAQY